jgi:hypothetical protein
MNMKDVKNNNRGWLRRTRQFWKLEVFFAMVLLGVAMILLMGLGVVSESSLKGFTMGLVVCSFMWLAFSIRCPKCGKKPMLRLVRTVDYRQLSQTFICFQACPHCGSSADTEEVLGGRSE